ncbi:lipoprotein, putative [Pseudomonas fluorescens A506]|nr:lipoprotein, putative [Pseudomonas fluorescens A506]
MRIHPTPRDPTVGAGLPAMAACQPTPIYLTPRDQFVGAGLPAKAA